MHRGCCCVWEDVHCAQQGECAAGISIDMHDWAIGCFMRAWWMKQKVLCQHLLIGPINNHWPVLLASRDTAIIFRTYGIALMKLLLHFHVKMIVTYNWLWVFHSYVWILNVHELGFGKTVILSHAHKFAIPISNSHCMHAFC